MTFVQTHSGEFNSKACHDYLLVHGAYCVLTCSYIPEHNSVIERILRTINEASTTLLIPAESGLWAGSTKVRWSQIKYIAPPNRWSRLAAWTGLSRWDDLWTRPAPSPHNLDDDFLSRDGSLLTIVPARLPSLPTSC